MSILVHLTDEKNKKKILKNGIKVGKYNKGIYCMPKLGNYFITYQWIRELKRNGTKTIIAVHFKIDTNEKVWAGKYYEKHKKMSLNEAYKELQKLEDPLGYEIFIERKITAKEIKKIKNVPQKIGWRYKPHSHLDKIKCGCPMCMPKGSIKSRKLRLKLGYVSTQQKIKFSTYISEIKQAIGPMTICNLLTEIGFRKWKKDPIELSFLIESKWKEVQLELALTLLSFKFRNSKNLLLDLIQSTDYKEVKEKACETLLKLDLNKGIQELEKIDKDDIIERMILKMKENGA